MEHSSAFLRATPQDVGTFAHVTSPYLGVGSTDPARYTELSLQPPLWLSTAAGPMNLNGVGMGAPTAGLFVRRVDSERILGSGTWDTAGIMAPLAHANATLHLVANARGLRPTLQTSEGAHSYAVAAGTIDAEVVRVNDDGSCPVVEITVMIKGADLCKAAAKYAELIGCVEFGVLAVPHRDAERMMLPLWFHAGTAHELALPDPGTHLGLHVGLGPRAPVMRPTEVLDIKRLNDMLAYSGVPSMDVLGAPTSSSARVKPRVKKEAGP